MTRPSLVVITDLDGTLLDHETYSFDAARPALERLRRDGVPLVLCTSKTRDEVEMIRAELGNEHPFIVENGGAVVVPAGYFPFVVESHGAEERNGAVVIPIGDPYEELVAVLARLSSATRTRVVGFAQMTDRDVAEATGLSLHHARLAREREFDEPFEVLDGADPSPLLDAITRAGKRWTAGGRFYHITGPNDKARAVRMLVDLYRRQLGTVTTIGLGDAPNDVEFLREVDQAVVIASPRSAEVVAAVPHAVVSADPGPLGWAKAVMALSS